MNEFEMFVKNFTDEKIEGVMLYKNNLYLKNPVIDRIEWETFAPGIILGSQKKKFKPSAYLLELLSERSSNKIFVNDKAEWLFLCGRDVFEKSIVQDKATTNLFLVQNLKDENLGIGRKVKKGRDLLIKNEFDRGDFLRRER